MHSPAVQRDARTASDTSGLVGWDRIDSRFWLSDRSGAEPTGDADVHSIEPVPIISYQIDMRATLTVVWINLKTVSQRSWTTLAMMGSIALVVVVLLAFLAMANGFRQTLVAAGADDVAIILRGGSQSEVNSVISREQVKLIEEAPGVLRVNGTPAVTAEVYLVVNAIKRSTGRKANIPLRGLGDVGSSSRANFRITHGRSPLPGTNEILVGKGLEGTFRNLELGSIATFGSSQWRISGIFETNGSVFESEVWGDLSAVQSAFRRNNIFQVVRVRLKDAGALSELKQYIENEPRLKLDVKSEAVYFAGQSARRADLIRYVGWPLAIAMAFGALAGALNTMYSSVSQRATEIATLRAIGFSAFSAFAGTIAESCIIGASGGVLGALLARLVFEGLETSTLGDNFTQVVFAFRLSFEAIWQGLLLALLVGLLGGVFPAIRAAKMPISRSLQR